MDTWKIFRLLPGKSGNNGSHLPLWMHLEDTASVTEYLCTHRIPDSVINACALEREEFKRVAVFLAMVHDIGKCTPLFASRITVRIPNRQALLLGEGVEIPLSFNYPSESPHARAGEAILLSRNIPCGICSVVGTHHGKPRETTENITEQLTVYKTNYYAKQQELWDDLHEKILQNALTRSGYIDVTELPKLSNCAQMLLCGLLIQADWIASNETYFPLLSAEENGDAAFYPTRTDFAFSALALPDCLEIQDAMLKPEDLFAERFGFLPNSMQKYATKISRSMPSGGLMIIEAQMGTGKTEAALAASEVMAAASGCSGVFFGLPTQATTNGIFPRLIDWAERLSRNSRHTVRLVHGMAELNEDYRRFFRGSSSTDDDGDSGLIAHEWFCGKKQALLADYVVGTVDTALMTALSQKHVMLRHLGLCSKVVIIDEVHAYDAYMSRFLDRMLRWLGAYHVPVILLSATLPEKKKKEMLVAYTGYKKLKRPETAGYPLITWTQGDNVYAESVENTAVSREINVNRLDETAVTDDIKEKLREGGCVGIIVNTVKRAQLLAESLRDVFPRKRVFLYHAQFISEDRISREKELMRMIGKYSTAEVRDNVIVVGTQVLEQSLDIDFDYLISDLCPIDLLLQRMGRLHRHNRARPATMKNACCSVLCVDEAYKSIYDEWLLHQTAKQLPETIRLPADIPGLVESVYSTIPDDENDKTWQSFQGKIKKEENKAGVWLLKEPRASKYEFRNSLVGMMDYPIENEQHAEASVRDGLPSVDVLVMRMLDNEHIGFMPWICELSLRRDAMPSESEAKKIAMQRLRLPIALCCGKQRDHIISTLEKENAEAFPLWQETPWLNGELVLILDENGERELCGYYIRYEKEIGLRYERRSD